MQAAALEYTKNRMEVRDNHFKNIQDYGEQNDYPQSIKDIVAASVTGQACLRKYIDFVYGRGFACNNYQVVVNREGMTMDQFAYLIISDYCLYGGFAIHINRNLLGQITSVHHVPLENVRFCIQDDPKYKNKVALHVDWGNRKRKLRQKDIEYIDTFTRDKYEFIRRVAETEGGILNYKGEIFYYSNMGEGNYPIPIFDSVLTDMVTQEALANITYRNAKNGFMPGLIFAEINETYDPNNQEDQNNFDALSEELKKMQGDKNAAKILHVTVPSKDQVPVPLALRGVNYDKDFTVSRESSRLAIGQCFMQPAEIRCEDTTKGFSNDTMEQAYKVYNSTTEGDRIIIEGLFASLFKIWCEPIEYNFQIKPLAYGTESLISAIGDKVKDAAEIAKDTTINVEQRKAILMHLYDIPEDIANKLLLIKTDDNANNN